MNNQQRLDDMFSGDVDVKFFVRDTSEGKDVLQEEALAIFEQSKNKPPVTDTDVMELTYRS